MVKDKGIYWVVVSKRYRKLWKPKNKDDFYDSFYKEQSWAEDSCPTGYVAVQVEVRILEDNE